MRFTYDTDDLHTLANIERFFPGSANTPFSHKTEHENLPTPCSLARIEQFVVEAEQEHVLGKAITDSSSDNIFFVYGRKGPIMVSVREKLGTWRMRHVELNDSFRGLDAYVFI